MHMRCLYSSYTHIGDRENNEDALLMKDKNGAFLFAVADGLGGHDCGEVASGIAVDTLQKLFESDEPFDPSYAIMMANIAVVAEQVKTEKSMRTTVAAVLVKDNMVTIAHAGDTRVYYFRNGAILTRTLDHSASQMAVRAGEITPDEIRNHADRNVLTKVLGGSENVKPEVTVLSACDSDAILICSDGFWEYVLEDDMTACLKSSSSPEKWLKKMRKIRAKCANKGCDNNTAVAVFISQG